MNYIKRYADVKRAELTRTHWRLGPPAFEIRRDPSDSVRFDDYTVPEGAPIVPVWVCHRDERFRDDPRASDSPPGWVLSRRATGVAVSSRQRPGPTTSPQ